MEETHSLKNVTITFLTASDWYKKYQKRTYTVLLLSRFVERFAFSMYTDDYIDDEMLINLANSIGTVDAPLVKISYDTDEDYVQIKRWFVPSIISHNEDGVTTFVFEYTKN